MKKLYGVGTGPGDKEFLTLKAVNVIQNAKVLFAPNNKGKNMALDTIEDYIKNQKVILIDFPMGKVTKEDYINAAKIINKEIPNGQTGAFLTIGDPMIYSTFIYIMKELERLNMEIEIVPGIPSFIAGAAKSKIPITVKGDNFLLCDEFKEELLEKIDSISILKTLKDKEYILNSLEKKNFDYKYIKRCTLEDEKVMVDKGEILKDKDYISFIIGRRKMDD